MSVLKQRFTAYLSGPMTGYVNYNHAEFNRITEVLEKSELFKRVINPASMDEGEKPWKYYLKRDLRIIMDNDVEALVLMPHWEDSKGARAEVYVAAQVMGAKLFLYEDTADGFKLTPYTLPERIQLSGVIESRQSIKVTVKEETTV